MRLLLPSIRILTTVTFLLCLSPLLASGDSIVLNNGDRLSGKILQAEEGVLSLETEYAGIIKLQMAAIAEINSADPHKVLLTGGEELHGPLSTLADQQLQVGSSGQRSASVVDWAQVAAINPPPPEETRWHGDITLGGTMKSGNTDSRDTSVALSGVRRGVRDRISLKLRYEYGEEDNVRTAESTFAAMKYDYFITEKFYTLAGLELLSDEFKDLNLRTQVGPGLGYQLFEEEKRSLALEAGLTYVNEDRKDGEDESWLSARLAAFLREQLLEWLVFTDDLLIYPNLEEGGEYQLRNEASLISALSSAWSFKLTNIYEHDSQPAPGIKKDDLTWTLGLQYTY